MTSVSAGHCTCAAEWLSLRSPQKTKNGPNAHVTLTPSLIYPILFYSILLLYYLVFQPLKCYFIISIQCNSQKTNCFSMIQSNNILLTMSGRFSRFITSNVSFLVSHTYFPAAKVEPFVYLTIYELCRTGPHLGLFLLRGRGADTEAICNLRLI